MDHHAVENRTMQAVTWRLLPFLFVLYVVSFLDRSNVSIAALQMNDDLKFSPAVFGLGAGIFFVGYALFEIPSNLILARVGARLWIARIMITWGLLASATMFVRTPREFYAIRFLLGVAEAGFFPGIIYYLAQWYPTDHRARAMARFGVAIPLSQVLSGAVGGPILGLRGVAHLAGWQWLFLLEGLPALILGIAVVFYLTDRPVDATWLSDDERLWLIQRLEAEESTSSSSHKVGPASALVSTAVWWLTVPYFAYYTVGYAYTFWAPLLVRSAFGTGDMTTGLATAGIALISVIAYLIPASVSDRSHDRCGLAALGLAISAAGCLGTAVATSPLIRIAALATIPIGGGVFLPSFWCLPTARFSGAAAAAVIGFISAVGSTGGFFGPNIIGYAKTVTGSDAGAFISLACIGIIGTIICVGLRRANTFGITPKPVGAV